MKSVRILFAALISFTIGSSIAGATELSSVGKGEIKPIESTTAFQMLELEFAVREKIPDKDKTRALLVSAIENATLAAQTHRMPRTKEEALPILEAIQVALVKHNFIQPLEQKDWPQTLGAALTPRTLTEEEKKRLLLYARNVRRVRFLNLSAPLYFVDCDMGAQFFIAVAERLGWDMRLVEVPLHNFVRWHISENVKVNWDWTRWESSDDAIYGREVPVSEDPRLKALYIRSWNPEEARAFYEGLIGSQAEKPEDGERLLQKALLVIPNHPTTLNNLAWLIATRPTLGHKSAIAVAFSLAAWSMQTDDGNIADTVACAFAADKQKLLAQRIEEFAIAHAYSESQRTAFKKNLELIVKGELCNP